jgi:hypothetical protein
MKIHGSIQFPFTLDDEHNNNIFEHFILGNKFRFGFTHNKPLKNLIIYILLFFPVCHLGAEFDFSKSISAVKIIIKKKMAINSFFW